MERASQRWRRRAGHPGRIAGVALAAAVLVLGGPGLASRAGSTGPVEEDDRAAEMSVVEIEPSPSDARAVDGSSSGSLAGDAADCTVISRIEIWKKYRALVAHCAHGGGVALRVALGREEAGPKRAGRDNRTPEGYYHIAGPARRSQKFHLFLPIDYPSRADAELGLALGTIDEPTYEHIVDALEEGRVPPQDTPLGGHLGFHGEGERWKGDSVSINWTYGCIALDDEQIEFLSERAPAGTPVIIRP